MSQSNIDEDWYITVLVERALCTFGEDILIIRERSSATVSVSLCLYLVDPAPFEARVLGTSENTFFFSYRK